MAALSRPLTVEHTYNRQGEVKKTKDQNGTIHELDFDKLGRQIHDRITALGSNIDNTVLRISTTYEVRGMVEAVTSYDNATVGSGTILNEVLRTYNNARLLDKDYQEHSGAKDENTPYVSYNYDDTASGGEFTNGLRPTSIRYPDGRLVHRTYGSSGSDSDNLNRLDAIKDDNIGLPGATLAAFTYLGANAVVVQDLEEPDVKLDYFGGTSGTYAGLDDFDRVIDHIWSDYGASEDRDRFQYGYDRTSNRMFRENTTTTGKDEFYTYDGMHRLRNFDRGDLNASRTAISGTPIREEDWTLDPIGNWTNYIQETSGTTDLDQDRTVNEANEIIDIVETTGTAWATPSHDRNGNMTSMPQPNDLASNYDCTWDAWNRLVKVKDGSTTVADYDYDGLMRRAAKTVNSTVRQFFYSAQWQVLEERLGSSSDPKRQFIWGPLYVDHLILRDRDTSDPPNGDLDERIYALQDANWNVTCLIDGAGDVIERLVYDPYGICTILDGSYGTRSSSVYSWDQGFTGMRLDEESALYNFRIRYYNAALGQFVSRDPLSYSSGLNLFAADFAVNNLDPLGTHQLPNRSLLHRVLPPYVRKAYNAPCEVNCNLAYLDCVKSDIDKDDCLEPTNKCLEFCKSLAHYRLTFGEEASAGTLLLGIVEGVAGLAGVAASVSGEASEKILSRIAKSAQSYKWWRIGGGVLSAALAIKGVADTWSYFSLLKDKSERVAIAKLYKDRIELALDKSTPGEHRSGQCYGSVSTGSFFEGFWESEHKEVQKRKGFWIHPCPIKGEEDVVYVYVRHSNGTWHRGEHAPKSNPIPDDQYCFFPDEIFRIQMHLNWLSHMAEEGIGLAVPDPNSDFSNRWYQ